MHKELHAAIKIAELAGVEILKHYRTDLVTEEKIGIDNRPEPVTVADREASRIIVNELSQLFPADAILSEEETDHIEERLTKDRVWIIDPIDGTSGFIKQDDDFAVQIGLSELGKPIVGVVYLPARNTLYFASRGEGTYKKDTTSGRIVSLAVSSKKNFHQMDIAVSRNHRSSKMTSLIRQMGLRREIERGSVGVKIGLIAEQLSDLYIHLSQRTKVWDTCAPQIILEEAGGKISDLFGNNFVYDQRSVLNLNGIVATNGVVHDKVIRELEHLLQEIGRPQL